MSPVALGGLSMPSRPGSRLKLANAVETGPVRGYTYDEGREKTLFSARSSHVVLFFFHIHSRRRLDRE